MMPAPTPQGKARLDFHALAAQALMCSEQWQAWAKQHAQDLYQSRRAQELAGLFKQQSRILEHMHHNRVEWHPITKNDAPKV